MGDFKMPIPAPVLGNIGGSSPTGAGSLGALFKGQQTGISGGGAALGVGLKALFGGGKGGASPGGAGPMPAGLPQVPRSSTPQGVDTGTDQPIPQLPPGLQDQLGPLQEKWKQYVASMV